MRYAEYHKKITRLDQRIAVYIDRETRATSGNGPWFVKLFPSLRQTAIDVASRKRVELARERARLEREQFGGASLLWNADPVAVFRRTVPSSQEAIERLRAAADAAYDQQR